MQKMGMGIGTGRLDGLRLMGSQLMGGCRWIAIGIHSDRSFHGPGRSSSALLSHNFFDRQEGPHKTWPPPFHALFHPRFFPKPCLPRWR